LRPLIRINGGVCQDCARFGRGDPQADAERVTKAFSWSRKPGAHQFEESLAIIDLDLRRITNVKAENSGVDLGRWPKCTGGDLEEKPRFLQDLGLNRQV
jgi:hypothetical protein